MVNAFEGDYFNIIISLHFFNLFIKTVHLFEILTKIVKGLQPAFIKFTAELSFLFHKHFPSHNSKICLHYQFRFV